jgi:hypothetical protein
VEKPMNKLAVFLLAAASSVAPLHALCPAADCDPEILGRRSLAAARIDGPAPVIDGRLDEAAWAAAPAAGRFVESRPRPGSPAGLRSEALLLVDDDAIYAGLRYYDPQPETIQSPLLRRDDESASDWAIVEFDSRHDRRSAFAFGINPRGVQVDGIWYSDTLFDFAWNAVWQAAARKQPDGWTAEFRIPFSQLAFHLPEAASELLWGVNFYRYNAARGESSNWSPRYAGLGGIVSNFNDLRLPAPPGVRRLELLPYVAAGADNDRRAERDTLRAGLDLKAGLGSSFTLTATILPDFGQVEADPSQVNLRAFELFQAERRPFFLEGFDLFRLDTSLAFSSRDLSFAEESPFYSRRIGRPPRGFVPAGYETLSRPDATRILAAAKLSGQTAGGFTLGLFTALTDREEARVRAPGGEAEELTIAARESTTVARAVRASADGDTSFSLFLAELHRESAGELDRQLVGNSAALGAELIHRFGKNRDYELRSWILGSHLSGEEAAIARVGRSPRHYFQRPDAERLHDYLSGDSLAGGAGETRISKVGGAFRWDLAARAVSPGFDVDELGFQRHSDWLLVTGKASYEKFYSGKPIRHWIFGARNTGIGWSWDGETRAKVIDLYGTLDGREYWSATLSAVRDMPSLSTDWLRGGPALLLPERTTYSLALATDTRRASQGTLDLAFTEEPDSGSRSRSIAPFFNLRGSDFWQASLGGGYREDTLGWQFAGRPAGPFPDLNLVGRLEQRTLYLALRSELILSPRLSLQVYLQPFAGAGRQESFQRLRAARERDPARRFEPIPDGRVRRDDESGLVELDLEGDGQFESRLELGPEVERSLDGSLVLRWEYHPGSFVTLAYNHQREAALRNREASVSGALGGAFGDEATNVVLLKVSRRFGS